MTSVFCMRTSLHSVRSSLALRLEWHTKCPARKAMETLCMQGMVSSSLLLFSYFPAFMRLMALIRAWMDAVMISVSIPAPQVIWPSSFVMPI